MKSFVFISPEEHFTEVVKEACAHRHIKTPPQIEAYLVQLLKFYLNSKNLHPQLQGETTEKPFETFAEMYLYAMNSEPLKRKELMRNLADRSLYLTGFFSDYFQSKIVDFDYYVEIGSAAYQNLYSLTREETLGVVYSAFSTRFHEYVEVLNYISEKSMVQADQNVLRLYDRYLRTGSDLAREKLTELGVVTVPKEQLKLSKA